MNKSDIVKEIAESHYSGCKLSEYEDKILSDIVEEIEKLEMLEELNK